jgi:hypothetical protein
VDRLAYIANRLAPGAGAGNGIRTRDTKLGKLVLYQLSYARSTNIFNKLQEKSQGIFLCKGSEAILTPCPGGVDHPSFFLN